MLPHKLAAGFVAVRAQALGRFGEAMAGMTW